MAANIDSNLGNWSTTAGSNQPDTSDGADIVSDLRQIQAVVRKYLATKGADIASASTVDLSTATGNYIHVTHSTGTTAITSFGTVSAGMSFFVVFDITGGTLTLTNNATSMIIQGGANLTLANGDACFLKSLGSGNWRVYFFPAAGYQPKDAELTALAGLVSAANKLPMFSGSGTATMLDFKDEDNMASDSATALPSQQSVKAYADTKNIATQVAPGTSGNVLTSNGSAWTSAAPSAPVFNNEYISSQQNITLGGLLTLAHSLGSAPKLVSIKLKCTTADNNYSVGDIVEAGPSFQQQNSGGGHAVYSDATNVYIRMSTGSYQGHDKSSGTPVNLTTTSWKLLVYAWA